MSVFRSPLNPIIKPDDIKPSRQDYEVLCAFNAGVTRLKNEIILLLRVAERPVNRSPNIYLSPVYDVMTGSFVNLEFEKNNLNIDFSDSRMIKTPTELYLTSISHLRVARSSDGINFEIDETPALLSTNMYEVYGIEDPRITKIDDTYYINYSAISPIGITTCLASTRDFKSYQRHGCIFPPDNKDVEIFPEKVNGKYYALHRPSSAVFKRNEIWLAESPDLICWGNHKYVMGTREEYWDNSRVGGSAVPFRIKEGWLEIYHGATKQDRYCLGAVLLDPDEPWKVVARSQKPIMEPEADYEVNGFFGNVIFNNGVLFEDGIVKIYYGAADTYVGYAEIALEDVLKTLK